MPEGIAELAYCREFIPSADFAIGFVLGDVVACVARELRASACFLLEIALAAAWRAGSGVKARRFGMTMLPLWLSACTVGPDFTAPAVKIERAWLTPRARTAVPAGSVGADRFWAGFHDKALLRLLQMADAQSLTLQSTAESIKQAQQQIRIDTANLLPTVAMNGASNYSQPTIASSLQGQNLGATTNQVLGMLSWELDFWGQVRRAIQADTAALASSEYAYAAAKVSLEASVASTYVNLRMTERLIEVNEANLKEQAENRRVANAKFKAGFTSELDYSQADTQYQQTRSLLPALRQSLMQYQHALSVLLGETPDYFVRHEPGNTGLPAIPRLLPIGAPKDLLRRRPDVLQYELTAAQQSARIGVQEAALYPSFSLTGEFGYSAPVSFANLFQWKNRVTAYGATMTLPIFDRDKLQSEVNIQDSVFRQAVLAYQNQVLTAQQDVEDGLAQVKQQTELVSDDRKANDSAVETTQLSLKQYNAGQADFTTVSTAEQTHQQTSTGLVQAEAGLLQAYISTFRAIGGGWEPDDRPRPAVLASEGGVR